MIIKKNNIFRKNLIVWAINMLMVFLITLAFYSTLPIKTTQTLMVPKGSIKSIISQLNKKGYDLGIIDTYLLRFIGIPKSGWIDIGSKKLNRIDFLYKLTSSKTMIHKITLIPGETTIIFFDNIAKQLELNTTKLQTNYQTLSAYPEAGIYADTYHVPYGIKEKNLISFLLRVSEQKYKKLSNEILQEYNQTQWLRTLTIASIIQKEAANNQEMPIISSVIYNRLKKKMPLQMDGTLNYGKYSHIKITPERIRTDTTTFNTYKHKGLPSSPIGSVSIWAIKAAINPSKTDYLYFMKNAQGVHDFSRTFKKHRKNIQKAR